MLTSTEVFSLLRVQPRRLGRDVGLPRTSVEGSKMECGLERVTLDALMLLQEVAASGRADTAALIAKFRPERQRVRRLSEYCDEIFAEIRVA
jgi:hypothetical protein